MMKRHWILRGLKIAFFVLLAVAGLSYVVMALWNHLMPVVFGLHTISFWQALGLLALCRILFGGFGAHGVRSNARGRMADRCGQMTPEERERFRKGFLGRWGRVAAPDSNPSA